MDNAIKELIDSLPVIKYEDPVFSAEDGCEWIERSVKIEARYDHDEECLIIDGCDSRYADYWGEFRGNYPWVHPDLEKWAEERDLIVDWYDPGTLFINVLEVAS